MGRRHPRMAIFLYYTVTMATDSNPSSPCSPVGIVIPTYNRAQTLLTCLQHLERQTCKDFEVIVIDDGSTDDTPQLMEAYGKSTPLRFQYLRQKNAGPARGRNVAIAALQAPICILIGDDIFATPEYVAEHLKLHRERPEKHVAGVGLTRWSTEGQTVTPFMKWLDEGGMQFSYHRLLAGEEPTWEHFYTSNLSVKTSLLREEPFDERFLRAAMEDQELGYRLKKLYALELVFLPGALAYHLHPTSFLQACRRMKAVGAAAKQFYAIWPDAMPPIRRFSLKRTVRRLCVTVPGVLAVLTPIADLLTRVWCPNPLMEYTLRLHCAKAYEVAGRS